MRAAATLQRAIFERLSGDAALTALVGAGGVTDRLPGKERFPFVVLRSIESRDWSTASEPGEEHVVTIEIWSGKDGNLEAQTIAARVGALLDGAALSLAGHHLVNLLQRGGDVGRDGRSRHHRALLRFRAATEPEG